MYFTLNYFYFKADSENYILLSNRKAETVSRSILGWYTKIVDIEISKGELLVRKGDLLHVYVNESESAAFEYHNESNYIAPLFNVQYNLLKAIPTAKDRISVFMVLGWMDWGADMKKGDKIYIRVNNGGMECCSTAVVHYIGTMTGEHPRTMFGVEITVSGVFASVWYAHGGNNKLSQQKIRTILLHQSRVVPT